MVLLECEPIKINLNLIHLIIIIGLTFKASTCHLTVSKGQSHKQIKILKH